jgi:signal transduction histidine kinase
MILIIIEAILIFGSFGVLAYFQSQQSSLGNSINIAGKNRFLTASVLLQTEKYLYGLSSDISQLKAAMKSLESNIITLKQGGMISAVDLKPLPSNFLDLWNTVDGRWNGYKTLVTDKLLTSAKTSAATITDKSLTREAVESMASNLIESSDKLVTVLGQQTDKNTQNLLLLQILFAFLIIGILLLILYLVARMLRPIFALTQATSKVKNGILDVSIKQKGSDELSILSECFNSMIVSLRDHIKRQNELTTQLEAANEELKQKDRLKDEFINIAAHELRTPIQPILGLTEVLRSRKLGNSGVNRGYDDEFLSIIIRNAKRLQQLSADILDIAKIESHTLILKNEQFDVNEIISDAIVDYRNQIEKDGKNQNECKLLYKNSGQDIFIEADKGRITQVISNLVSNAVKFTKVGTVTIAAEKVKEQDRQQVIISVKDTGTGINPEMLPKLFTKFATKSDKGTGIGLGLFISKSIVEAHDGSIWAENNKDGKGATFAFSMPINKQQQLISSSSLGSK